MKNDHVQGILFNKSRVVRFREVPVPPKGIIGKTQRTKAQVIDILTATFALNHAERLQAKKPVEYVEYFVTKEKINLQKI